MPNYLFRVRQHPEFREWGVVSHLGSTHAEPAQRGDLIAHDILEHNFGPSDNGAGHFEWMATGFCLYGRVFGSYWGNFVPMTPRDPFEMLASNFYGIHSFQFDCDVYGLEDPGTYRIPDKLSVEFSEIANYLREQLLSFEEHEDQGTIHDCYGFGVEEYIRRAIGWIVRGYKKAVRKYAKNGVSEFHVANLFHQIETDFNANYTWMCSSEYANWMTLVVEVDFSSCQYSMYTREGYYD